MFRHVLRGTLRHRVGCLSTKNTGLSALARWLFSSFGSNSSTPLDDPIKESIRLAAMSGSNIFFTGSAGTGKSFTIDAIVEGLKAKHGGDYADAVAVTAPTGVASLLIGGQTLGSFAGAGVPTTTKDFVSYSCGCHTSSSPTPCCSHHVLTIDTIALAPMLLYHLPIGQVLV